MNVGVIVGKTVEQAGLEALHTVSFEGAIGGSGGDYPAMKLGNFAMEQCAHAVCEYAVS